MRPLCLLEVAEALDTVVHGASGETMVRRVHTDSRTVAPGDLFVALPGERFDGHRFIDDAVERGAIGFVAQRDRWTPVETGVPYLMVDRTAAALGHLATWYRRRVLVGGPRVIAITGSNGKTTTKCMLDHVLSDRLCGRAASRSFNNEIGVPLTVLSAMPDDDYLIVEIGTNAPGEVAELAAIARPDIAVITSIGEAHLEGLGDIHGVALEKSTILRHVSGHGSAYVNVDRSEILPFLGDFCGLHLRTFGYCADAALRVTNPNCGTSHTAFDLEGGVHARVPLPGRHHATNAAVVFGVAREMGLSPASILARLATVSAAEGRTMRVSAGHRTIVDDSYNANPASMTAAIHALAAMGSGRRFLVMGDMLELGERSAEFHSALLRSAAGAGLDGIYVIGDAMRGAACAMDANANAVAPIHFDTWEAAGRRLLESAAEGDTVWIKGSRRMGLDNLVRHLLDRWSSMAVETEVGKP